MLIYLDTMVVQYCVDYQEFLFGEITGHTAECPVSEPKLKRELLALRQLIFLDQLGDWICACSAVLLKELHARKPTDEQRKVYALLLEAWKESGWNDAFPRQSSEIARIESSLKGLNLRPRDRRHLAEAIVLNASWFLTNDRKIIAKCKKPGLPSGLLLKVARPSECLDEISVSHTRVLGVVSPGTVTHTKN